MNAPGTAPVTLFVDPCCPFAWITFQWLKEVQQETGIGYRLKILSLSVVNRNRDVDQWYRQFKDRAWGPVRVGAAILTGAGEAAFHRFYEAVGRRIHVDGRDVGEDILVEALSEAGIDRAVAAAARDDGWDPLLDEMTTAAVKPVKEDVGTPILHLPEGAFFGPVITSIPRDTAAVDLYHAVRTLARHESFVEYKRGRSGELMTH